jgi:hypothetical protein
MQEYTINAQFTIRHVTQNLAKLLIKCLTLIRAAGGIYDFQNFEQV